MPYPIHTILVRKEPLPDVEHNIGLNKQEKPVFKKLAHPLNRVKVLGPSPVSTSTPALEDWNGIGGAQSIVQPIDVFGSSEVVPDSVLNKEYSVEREGPGPEDEAPPVEPMVTKQQRLVSPEDVFAADAIRQEALVEAFALSAENE